jgi:hypothetical protein
MSENRFDTVRELVKDPSLRVTEIAWKTGYNKGHVSRLRKAAMRQELCREEIMSENKTAKTPADVPVAWQCQCGKAYTVTCISSKPAKREWVGLTTGEMKEIADRYHLKPPNIPVAFRAIEAKLKEKNHG